MMGSLHVKGHSSFDPAEVLFSLWETVLGIIYYFAQAEGQQGARAWGWAELEHRA